MHLIFSIGLFIPIMVFAQNPVINTDNLVPYIGDFNVGMQISPLLTGMKGNRPNQEIDINFVLYYQNKYTIDENQVVGHIEGRFISEIPLTEFDLYKRIREDNSLEISNYAESFKEYQEALKTYRLFQDNFNLSNTVITNETDDQNSSENEYDDQYYENQNADEYNTEYYSFLKNYSLANTKQKFVAQSLSNDFLPPFPNLNTDKTLSDAEIEFLIKFEQLKKKYNDAVAEYNKAVSQQKDIDFDPADPAERFAVLFTGENSQPIWIKQFGLDGKKTYQSYNSQVWYLGFQIPLTKKDVRALNNLFSKNNNIRYYIKGSKNTVDFQLSSYFVKAMRELVDLFVRGGLIVDNSTEYPIMRSYNAR